MKQTEENAIIAEWLHPIEWGKVREFARAVHDPRAGQEPPLPPPTFPVVLSADFIERFVNELLPLDRKRTVHGEQAYRYHRPLRIGKQVRCRARIVQDVVKEGKRGGKMRVVTLEIELRDADTEELLVVESMTAIEKGGATA